MEKKLFGLLDVVKEKLPVKDVENIKEYIEQREWGLAYETLSVQLYEFNIPLSFKFFKEAESIGHEMGIEKTYVELFKKLIRD